MMHVRYNFNSHRFLKSVLMMIQCALLVSCVGEVESTQKDITVSEKKPTSTSATFSGIHSVVPISNDKVEVYLFPAEGGSGNFSYQVQYNDELATGSEENLFRDYRGLLRVLITGLETGTDYSISSQLYDIDKDATILALDTSGVSTQTFSNEVTNFFGLSELSNVSGISGIDSINVRWVAAAKDPSSPFGTPSDPRSYEIILLEANKQTPGAVNNTQLTETDGRLVRSINWAPGLNNTVINGLKSDQEYYVFVRALHEDSLDDPSNPELRSELNNKYGIIKTLSSDATNIEFSDDFQARPGEGLTGLSSLSLNWTTITGVFDHLKIYYAFSGNLPPSTSIDTTSCTNRLGTNFYNNEIACKKISDTTISSTTLSDLPALQDYDVQLVVCQTADCSQSIINPGLRCNAQMPVELCNARTEVQLANFSGIESVTVAQDIAELGSLFLNYTTPDFTQGYFDGLVIEFTNDQAGLDNWLENPGAPKPVTEILNAADYSGDLFVENFDVEEDSFVEVSNVTYGGNNYCFSLYPFLYDNDGLMDDSQAGSLKKIWSCEKASAIGPTAENFRGFESGQTNGSKVNINWNRPSGGVYSHYEILYRKGSTLLDNSFSFDTAINDTTIDYDFSEYDRLLLSADTGNGEARTSHEFNGLTDGLWVFGIRTYYLTGIDGVLRSQETPQIIACEVDASSPTASDCTLME